MAAKTVSFLLALGLCSLASAQVQFKGACPSDVKVVPNFSVEKYLGVWYEYAKYPIYFEADGKCVTAKYTLQADGNVGVINSMIDEQTDKDSDIVGYAKLVENAKLLVTFPVSPARNVSSNYWVLDTDYESYSVVYSCQPVSDFMHFTTVWILTRERQPTEELIKKAESVLEQNGISLKELVITDQSGCN